MAAEKDWSMMASFGLLAMNLARTAMPGWPAWCPARISAMAACVP
jgi:hypothetical protein